MDDYKIKFQARLMDLVSEVVLFTRELPSGLEFSVIKKQLIRCVTSVGANYHAACRARSRPDYKHKLHIVEEECDESMYWMEVLTHLYAFDNDIHSRIIDEMNQILSIIIATLKTMDEDDKGDVVPAPAPSDI